MSYKPYPQYKDSGVEWLGEIPNTWECKRLKYVAGMNLKTLEDDTPEDYEFEYLDIGSVDKNGNVLATQKIIFRDAPSRARRLANQGDTILSTVRTYLRAIVFIDEILEKCVFSTGFSVLHPKEGLNSKFLFRLIQSNQFIDTVVANSEGVSYPAINPRRLECLPAWIPPHKEQEKISQFLDSKIEKIVSLITKKQQLVELLQEKRQALISQAVTKGLDSGVKIKDSGIESIDKIPEHWEMRNVRSFSRVIRGASPRPAGDHKLFNGNFMPWITVAEVTKDSSKYIDQTESYLTKEGVNQSRVVEIGTFLLSNSGATLGVPKITKIRGCINDGSVVLSNLSLEVDKDFLFYFFTSQTELIRIQADIGGQPNLNTNIVGSIYVPIPPKSEAEKIADFLDRKVKMLNVLVEKIENQIEKLTEYRQGLISAAVTGKIDLREDVA